MSTQAVSRAEQERLLDRATVLPVVNECYIALASGAARPFPTLREALAGGMLGFRGAEWPARALLGVKISAFFAGNRPLGLDSHQSLVVLLDPDTGTPRGIVDGNHVTWIRTALAGAAGTLALARNDARRVLVIGNGLQAEAQVRSHVWALAGRGPSFAVHAPRDGADGAKAADFSARLAAHGIIVEPAPDLRGALAVADVVVTVTPASEPVLCGAEIRPGTHVNAIGADAPGKRELDDAVLASASLFVDDREQSRRFGEGRYLDAVLLSSIPTIGDVLSKTAVGRQSRDELTVFDSTGLGLHDVATAAVALERATASGAGITLRL